MIFAPHILQLKVTIPHQKDEFGRPIPGTGGEEWRNVCVCRCDDNTTKEFTSENGQVYRPNFHVVCGEKVNIKTGDHVRCMSSVSIRGEGKVYMIKTTNSLNYSELWM